MSDTISKNLDWYITNVGILSSLYPNKYVVIKDKTVLFARRSFQEALTSALVDGLRMGEFNIQYCGDDGNPSQIMNPVKLEGA